jgi:NDP-sugar pyrophosphorylase family protein
MREFHKNKEFDITLVASLQHHAVPYGICEIMDGGQLKEIKEKPEFDFLVNAGMYLLEPTIFDLIAKNEYLDMTELIKLAQKKGLRVGAYPVSENSYIDVGQVAEYKRNLKIFFDDR